MASSDMPGESQIRAAMQEVVGLPPSDPIWEIMGKLLDLNPRVQKEFLRPHANRDGALDFDMVNIHYSYTLK